MSANSNKIIIRNFWEPAPNFPDSNLKSNEIGWTDSQKVESGGYAETKDIWDHLISHGGAGICGFDLAFFYLENRQMYLLDNIDHVIYEVPINPNWDGKYLISKYDYSSFDKENAKEVFEFDDTSEVWEDFTINGKNMKYILEHSVLILST